MSTINKILGSAFILLTLTSCIKQENFPYAYQGEYQRLINETKIEAKFSDYQPNFHTEKRVIDFIGKDGPYQDSIWVIMDGAKYVALYFAQDKPYMDIFAANPNVAPTELEMPVRHHNATLLGTRLTTSVWYDKWELTGDSHSRKFEGGGETLTLTEIQEWDKAGAYKREAISSHRFTFKVDPFLGYVVEAKCLLQTDDSTKRQLEFMNFMPRDAANPWPEGQPYTHTVFTPSEDSSYIAYSNNLLASNLSDETKTDWGKGFEVRQGGFTGMVGKEEYSPLLFRWGNVRFVHRTCDAWLDLHQHTLLPKPNEQDGYEVEVNYLFAYVPPTISSHIIANKQRMEFKRQAAVMIPLGVKEDFEKQPLPIDHIGIGLTKGFWEKDFEIDSSIAFSGNYSMRMNGKTPAENSKRMMDFIRYPQIPLKAQTKYKLEVMAKASDIGTKAWVEAATYEWTPYDSARLARYSTKVALDTTWQRLSLQFTTPDFDPFIDLRFRAEGEGTVLFDDFFFGPESP